MIGELKRRGGDKGACMSKEEVRRKLKSKTDMLCGQHRKLKFVP
jgi:hypothetical protein